MYLVRNYDVSQKLRNCNFHTAIHIDCSLQKGAEVYWEKKPVNKYRLYTMTKPRAGLPGVRISAGSKDFSAVRPGWLRAQPNLLSNGYRGCFTVVKRPGCHVDHSPSSSVEAQNGRRCACTPHVCPYGLDRNNFIFFHVVLFRSGQRAPPATNSALYRWTLYITTRLDSESRLVCSSVIF